MYNLNVNDPHFLPHCRCEIGFTLKSGEAIVISGENGLGKSTFLHRLYRENSHLMSIILQTPIDIFYDRELRILKQVFLSAGKAEIDKEFFLDCWSKFGLDKKEDRLQSSLSGGEGQALKICLGLSVKASIYVLDEPSQYLDEASKVILSHVIFNLLKMNKAVLMAEHDLNWQNFNKTHFEFHQVNQTLKIGKTWNT